KMLQGTGPAESVCRHPSCCTALPDATVPEADYLGEAIRPESRQWRDEHDPGTRAVQCSFSDSNGTGRICPDSFFSRISTRRSACSSFVWQNRDSLIPSSNNSNAESSDNSPFSSFLTISSSLFSAVSKSGASDMKWIVVDLVL